MIITKPSIIPFQLPPELACPSPTEYRHLERDEVRLLVTTGNGNTEHTSFKQLPFFLQKGDVLVVNTSATVPAALPVTLPAGEPGRLHVSTNTGHGEWLVEIREITGHKTVRWKQGQDGMEFDLPKGASVKLHERYYKDRRWLHLWKVGFTTNTPLRDYLSANASPIQYENLDRQYPLSWYQTFFSFHPGSSEMPSAGRAFTAGGIETLLKKGVVLAPIVLHTGVSSLEENETPYAEYMEIDPATAAVINAAKKQGRRIIAVGTTCIRAVETAAGRDGLVMPYKGETELFITEDYTMKVVDALLTGFHEPGASHLNMLQAIAGYDHIYRAYQAAINAGYYWHQFGDLHLILP